MMSVFGEFDGYIVAITDINNGLKTKTQTVLFHDQSSSTETSDT